MTHGRKEGSNIVRKFNTHYLNGPLMQGSQTRGPRAACEPPDVFMQPALSSKLLFLLIVETTVLFTFYALWWPAETFLPHCADREPFFHQDVAREHSWVWDLCFNAMYIFIRYVLFMKYNKSWSVKSTNNIKWPDLVWKNMSDLFANLNL